MNFEQYTYILKNMHLCKLRNTFKITLVYDPGKPHNFKDIALKALLFEQLY